MPAAVAIPALIGAGTVAGGLANRPKTAKTSSTPTWSPEDEAFRGQLRTRLEQMISDPGAGLQPLRTAAISGINRRYTEAPGVISQQLARRGYGKSGLAGDMLYRVESDRLRDLTSLEGMWAELLGGRQMQSLSLAEQLLGLSAGRSGTEMLPGNVGAGALTGGLQSLFGLMGMRAAMGEKGKPATWSDVGSFF